MSSSNKNHHPLASSALSASARRPGRRNGAVHDGGGVPDFGGHERGAFLSGQNADTHGYATDRHCAPGACGAAGERGRRRPHSFAILQPPLVPANSPYNARINNPAHTSCRPQVTVSIAGVVKEVLTIAASAVIYGDHLGPLNLLGAVSRRRFLPTGIRSFHVSCCAPKSLGDTPGWLLCSGH